MKQFALLFFFVFFTSLLSAQDVAIKNNMLYDLTATPNLGVEVGVSKHFSLDLSGGYHPWSFMDNKSLEHWVVQPELRYWLFERFDGHYIGLHAQYMDYKFSGLDLPWGMDKENGYDGDAFGAGISYGYQMYISPRWNLELTIGGGFNQLEYSKYILEEKGLRTDLGRFKRNYYGLTKLGISIVYIIK